MRHIAPLLLGLAIAACRGDSGAIPKGDNPPHAEFILTTADSAYWVMSDTGGVHVRGAPIELARLDGRFVELYVVDDDHSYDRADLVGQSVYRRDLRTGDSTRVFTDSLVPALAREYAQQHPDERRLRPDEEGDDDPSLRATATLEFAGTYGPFLSFSLHTDVERSGAPLWHTTRHGVVDLRSGKPARLEDIVGAEAADIERRRDEMLHNVLDSIRTRAAGLLPRFRFEPASFNITSTAGIPSITYAIPTSGIGEVDQALLLPSMTFREPGWWRDVALCLPSASSDGEQDTWDHGGYTIVARYDSTGAGRVVLRNQAAREWRMASISAPARRLYWVDLKAVDAETRRSLTRAFDEAASYGSETHIATRQTRSLYQLTSLHR